jgi:outer membrane beta-barrel protein
VVFFVLASSSAFAAISEGQDNYERSIDAVVRHKEFYKPGSIETSFVAGVMPYDSVINHYMAGGRLAWHFSDHFAWEVADVQVAFPSVSGFTKSLVTARGISNLQTTKLKLIAGTNFMVSPLYGKIRLLGARVLHFDVYFVAGLGMAKTDGVQYGTVGTGSAMQELVLKSGFDPMFDFGLGFKLYFSRGVALLIDLRDYVVYSETYNSRQPKSNFSVYAGVSFFIPTLGG